MKLKTFNDNMADINAYLLIKNKEAILIDPGFNGKAIITYCKDKAIDIKHVILTHGHFDHIKDIEILAKDFTYDLFVSKHDKNFLFSDELNYARAFGSTFKLPPLEIHEVEDQQVLNLLDESFQIFLTPGHTKGSICIKIKNQLFSGDTLFYNSVGRTDLYSGNQSTLFKSLEILKSKVSNDVTVYPGHGKSAKMKEIKEINPYI